MDLLKVIQSRRSVRQFKDIPIPDELIIEMLEAARHAPSGGNSQNHCFGIVKDPLLKQQLAESAGGQMWIAQAPVVFACCADISWDIANQPSDDFGVQVNHLRFGEAFIKYLCDYPDRQACVTLLENASPLIPAEHIFLTAASHGLSACFVGYLDIVRASRILNLPENMRCFFLLPVGYADEAPGEKAVKTVSEISFLDTWKKA